MVFNSYTFIAFFLIMLLLHNLPISWRAKKINLLLASYVFYAAWNPPFILLLWLSTVVDFFVGRALYTQQNVTKKRLLLVLSLIGNLGMLCFFKYGTFLLENFVTLVNLIGIDFNPAEPNIILPAGISFYTFTTLCYTIDMYHKKSEPVKSMLDFSLFVTFFPHLVAGPIVRPPQLVPQFETPRNATMKQITEGLLLLTLGLFMKVVLADGQLAPTANDIFGNTGAYLALDAWMGVLAFSGQIFFDFAGYSTCAIGVALCLGFILPENFKYPYAAVGFSDFWQRWHITLSAWLRDYLYIPLGGNRQGQLKTYINLMVTMLLGGLWHGANWTYVIWGALNGAYMLLTIRSQDIRKIYVNKLKLNKFPYLYKILQVVTTFSLTCFAWIFFRANNLSDALYISKHLFAGITHIGIILTSKELIKTNILLSQSKEEFILAILAIFFMETVHLIQRHESIRHMLSEKPVYIRWAIYYILIFSILFFGVFNSTQFIYFQF